MYIFLLLILILTLDQPASHAQRMHACVCGAVLLLVLPTSPFFLSFLYELFCCAFPIGR